VSLILPAGSALHPLASAVLAVDDGSPGYVVAAVIAAAALVLVYLLIVVIRVRDSAQRLELLEQRLDRAEQGATSPAGAGLGEVPASSDALEASR
jgi:hypothetical protein